MKTREEWLQNAVSAMRPWFVKQGKALPKKIRIGVGFSSKGAKSKTIGQCWDASCSKSGHFEIFIHPGLDANERVLDVLAHELCHAAVGLDHKHGPVFKACAEGIGLTGKMTATVAGDLFKENAKPVLKKLGKFPHAALHDGANSGPKKQGSRLLKVWCPSCEYTMRVTAKWLDVAVPTCPNDDCENHGSHMEC